MREKGSKNLRIQWTVKWIKKLVEIEKKRGKDVSKRRDIRRMWRRRMWRRKRWIRPTGPLDAGRS